MREINKREPAPIEEGMMWRHIKDRSNFSSELYIGTGDSIDNYEKVPVSVYEQYREEEEAKEREQMMQ